MNLCIERGTLNDGEREVINNHIVATIKMLESLPYPPYLTRVPEYAGGHHERMDGKGYPRGLTREQMSVQARVMGIADIFEALTAADRPYKKAMPLSASAAGFQRMRIDVVDSGASSIPAATYRVCPRCGSVLNCPGPVITGTCSAACLMPMSRTSRVRTRKRATATPAGMRVSNTVARLASQRS